MMAAARPVHGPRRRAVRHPVRCPTPWLAVLLVLAGTLASPLVRAQEATAAPASDETIVSGLSHSRVSITADFDGSEILVYGAIRRETPAPPGRVDVAISVTGPSGPVTIRRKDRVWGIWTNDAAVSIKSAPSFFALATTRPLNTILSATDNFRHAITIDRLIRKVGIASQADTPEDFIAALVRVRTDDGRYRLLEHRVLLTEDTLFRTDFALPSNLLEGDYAVRIFVLRDGKVVATQERKIFVRMAGIERTIYNLAREQPLAYGLLSIVLAAAAGWIASTVFRLIRR